MKNLLILAILGALLTVGFSHPRHSQDDSFNGNPLSHRPRPPMPPPDFVDFGEDAEFESDSSDFSDNDDLEGKRPIPPPFNDNDKDNGEFLPPPPLHHGGHHGKRPSFRNHPRFRGPRSDEEGSNIAQNEESLKEVDIEGSLGHHKPPHHPHKFNKSEGLHHPSKHGHGKRHGGFDNEQDKQRGPGDRKGPHHKRGHKGHGKSHKRFPRKPEETNDTSFDDIVRNEKLIKVVPVEKL